MNLGFWQGPFPVLATCPFDLERRQEPGPLGGGGAGRLLLRKGPLAGDLLSAPPPCVSRADSQPAPRCTRTQAPTVSSLYSQIPSTFNHLPPNSQEPLHPGTLSEEGGRHGEEGSAPSQLMSV